MPKISVVMIVKNESECLSKCLESVKSFDEIIICDTGSEDNTVEIAKKYTDKVFEDFTWCDDFAAARNHALAKATGDWVLSIDADEYLHDPEEVRKAVLLADAKGFLGVDCNLIHENTKTTHAFPRLFKRCKDVWWEGAVHNHIEMTPPFKRETLGNVEITYGYSPAHQKDPDRALRILQKEVDRTGNGRETFYLGMEYWYRRNFEKCLEIMNEYLPKSNFLWEKSYAYLIMSRCFWALGKGDDARTACAMAIVINANFKEALEHMANLSWPKNAERWRQFAELADNSEVLFAR